MRFGPTVLLALLSLSASAQEEESQVPTFRTGVDAVLVDVVVLDSSGKPVRDLRKEDFRVLEDGVPQTIATFDVTDWTSYVGERTGAPPSGAGVNAYPRRFIFIINRQGARFEYITRAKRDLASFVVDSMAEGDEAMVVDVGHSFKVVQELRSGKQETLQSIRAVSQMQIDYPMGADRAADLFYRDLQSLGEALLEIPGRKIVILFSNELLTFPGPGSRAVDSSFSLQKAIESLNQANVSVYTLDIRGPDSSMSIRGGLSPLATETGGRFFRNNTSFKQPLERIGTENQRYYLLSYVSTNSEADGSYRKIAVEVAREDVSVIARKGYFAREPVTRTTKAGEERREEPASGSGPASGSSPDLPLALELTTYLLPTGVGTVRVPVSVALPGDLLSGNGGGERKLGVRIADSEGRTVASFEEPVSPERYYVIESVDLEPGPYLLELTVSSSERELHRASTAIDIPAGLGDRFGLSSILPVVAPTEPRPDGEELPLLPAPTARRGEPLHVLFQVFAGDEEPSQSARVRYRILDERGEEISSGGPEEEIALSSRPDGTPVILSVPTRSLSYGTYRVEVRVEDPSTGRAASSDIELRVR